MDDEEKETRKAIKLFKAAGYNVEFRDGGISIKKNNKRIGKEAYIKLMLLLKENGISAEIPHPDRCWIITDWRKKPLEAEKDLLIFSNKEAIYKFVENYYPFSYKFFIRIFDWNDLVDRFSQYFEIAILDFCSKEEYMHIPLLKTPKIRGEA